MSGTLVMSGIVEASPKKAPRSISYFTANKFMRLKERMNSGEKLEITRSELNKIAEKTVETAAKKANVSNMLDENKKTELVKAVINEANEKAGLDLNYELGTKKMFSRAFKFIAPVTLVTAVLAALTANPETGGILGVSALFGAMTFIFWAASMGVTGTVAAKIREFVAERLPKKAETN